MFKKIFRTLLITEEEKEAREKKLAIRRKRISPKCCTIFG